MEKTKKRLTFDWLESRTLLSTMTHETEPNNTALQADQMVFDSYDRAGVFAGNITKKKDTDTFHFQTGVAGRARVRFLANDGLQGKVTVKNELGQTLLERSSAGTASTGRFTVGPGHDFMISVNSDRKTTGNYTVQLQLPQTTCEILTINIQQLHADLLGLQVDSSEIDVRVSGQTGTGKLLGNLACELVGGLGGGIVADVAAEAIQTATTRQLQRAVNQVSSTVDVAALPSLPDGTTCEILNLDIGPVHVDLLGLVIDTNRIVIDVTAETGSGKLLGNLLCALAHLLDSAGGSGTLSETLTDPALIDNIDDDLADAGLVEDPTQEEGECDIVNLVLGPVHLDLLGAVVDTNRIEVDITGETGPDRLLGNLACALAGLIPAPTTSDALMSVTATAVNEVTTSNSTLKSISNSFSQPTVSAVLPSCDLLMLHIEELHVDLLGLVIDTGPIDVQVRGVTGPGKLLGNLLCSLAGALDGVL